MPCRLNALRLPLVDGCVDGAVADSVLHLISEPGTVLREIHRVLRAGGRFISGGPAALPDDLAEELRRVNRSVNERVQAFHTRYWDLVHAAGVQHATRWRIDEVVACAQVFGGDPEEVRVPFWHEGETTMADGYLRRLGGKGFSDQQSVPDALHERIFSQVVEEFAAAYGPDFDSVTFRGVTGDLLLRVFTK